MSNFNKDSDVRNSRQMSYARRDAIQNALQNARSEIVNAERSNGITSSSGKEERRDAKDSFEAGFARESEL